MSTTEQNEQQEKRINPLLKRKTTIPGQSFRLPSRGLFYTSGELSDDVINGELVIHPLTTADEIIMKSPDMLFKGTAIEKVIDRCIPQVSKPMDLLCVDVDYILTCLRKISYGLHIPIKYKCTKCAKALEDSKKSDDSITSIKLVESHEYLIPVDHFLSNSKEVDDKYFKNFKLKLSNSGDIIEFKPPTFKEAIAIEQTRAEDLKTDNDIIDFMLRPLVAVIKSVNGHSDKDDILEWVKREPRGVHESLKTKLKTLNNWGPVFSYTITCKDCGEQIDLTTPLNPVAFFMLPSSPETRV